ncbi:MAG: 1-acyl-sn-glycerol-3-phosphate acyltransferase [Candidatus Symbiothrix sp.]|nr:1-acyl-sn-glycerol-3-phosphate acyltransferase [Candidatus Symbiothrix sp.]
MKRILILLYQVLIWLPFFAAATIVAALSCTVGCLLGGERIFSYYPGMLWSRFACWISLCPVKIVGREKLDKKQSYIFVGNHQGIYDIFLLYGYLGFPIKWIMKQSLRKILFVGKACEAAGFIFVDNSSPVAAAKTIKEAEKRLKNGASITIFPEGSRSHTGKLGKFKKGAYQMALNMKLPIVPVTINGSFEVMPRSSIRLHPHRLEVIIHEPIATDNPIAGDLRTAATVIRSLSEQSREAIELALWKQYK